MHGSSSVPQEWLKTINEHGGELPRTYGVPVTEIQEGIRHGVRKVNIDTDLRLAATGAVRKFLAENPADFDPRKFLTAAMHAMKEVCRSRFLAFGTAGWGRNITPSNHETMAVAYADGRFASRPPAAVTGREAWQTEIPQSCRRRSCRRTSAGWARSLQSSRAPGWTGSTGTSWTAASCPTSPSARRSSANAASGADLFFDVHLMIDDPGRYVAAFAEAGADLLCVHAEAETHLERAVSEIARLGMRPAVALNPHTPLSAVEYLLPQLHMVLVMSVNPGFGGQSFIPFCIDKVRKLDLMIQRAGADTLIQVDGRGHPGQHRGTAPGRGGRLCLGFRLFRPPSLR